MLMDEGVGDLGWDWGANPHTWCEVGYLGRKIHTSKHCRCWRCHIRSMHGRCALGANNTSPTPLIGGMASKVSQFVKEVVNFSSQYGTHGSRSYTAANLAGGFNIYDGYGDRTEAFVLVSGNTDRTVFLAAFFFSVRMDIGGKPALLRLESSETQSSSGVKIL